MLIMLEASPTGKRCSSIAARQRLSAVQSIIIGGATEPALAVSQCVSASEPMRNVQYLHRLQPLRVARVAHLQMTRGWVALQVSPTPRMSLTRVWSMPLLLARRWKGYCIAMLRTKTEDEH